MKKSVPLFLAFSLLLSACRNQPTVQAGDLNSLTAALDTRLPKLLAAYKVPGAALALVADGEVVWTKGYGYADLERNVPVTSDTIFQVASISKTVAAWGVLRLAEQGKIDLDAPIDRYVTRWSLPPSEFDASGVTVRRLLSHSAGLSLHGYPGLPPEEPLPSIEESLSGQNGGAGDVHIEQPPGQAFSYSGGGYTLLQLMVEEVSGMPFADFMRQEVLAPLGMTHSSYEWLAELRPATATGYDSKKKPLPNYLFTEQAAAGLYTTASELALFGAAALSGEQGEPAGRGVVSPATVEALFTPTIPIKDDIGRFLAGVEAYGLGYFLETLPDGSRLAGHSGGNQGWRSQLFVAPAQRAALVILTNSDNGSSLIPDAAALWGQWLGAGELGIASGTRKLNTAAWILVLILGVGLAARLFWLFRKMRRKERRFSLKPRWGLFIGLPVALLLAVAWLTLGNWVAQDLTPLQAPWLGTVILLWAAAIGWDALLA